MITAPSEPLSHWKSSPYCFSRFCSHARSGYNYPRMTVTLPNWCGYHCGKIEATTLPSHSLKLGITLAETIHVRTFYTPCKKGICIDHSKSVTFPGEWHSSKCLNPSNLIINTNILYRTCLRSWRFERQSFVTTVRQSQWQSQRSKHHPHNLLTVQIWPLSDPSDIKSIDLILKQLDPDMEFDNEDVSKQAQLIVARFLHAIQEWKSILCTFRFNISSRIKNYSSCALTCRTNLVVYLINHQRSCAMLTLMDDIAGKQAEATLNNAIKWS